MALIPISATYSRSPAGETAMPAGLTPRTRDTSGEGTIRSLAAICVRAKIDALDHVVVAVGDVEGVAMDRQEIRRAAADGFAVVGGGADQEAGFDRG